MHKHAALVLMLTAGLGAVPLPAAAVTDPCLDATKLAATPYPSSLATTDGILKVMLFAADCTDGGSATVVTPRSEEHTSELQSHHDLVCRLLLEKKKKKNKQKQTKKKKKKKIKK